MFWRLTFLLLVIAITTLSSGCSTLADARAAKGTGATRIFDAPIDTVWKQLPAVVKEVGLDIVGDNKQDGYMLAQRGITPFSYGEHVAIFIEEVARSVKTRVEVVSKKALATNIFVPNWETEILDNLAQKLKQAGVPAVAAVIFPGAEDMKSLQVSTSVEKQPSPTLERDVQRSKIDIRDVFSVPFLKETGRNGYEKFLEAKRRPRVFVLSEKGAWSWKTGPNAADEALQSCGRFGAKCMIYAVDNDVVWKSNDATVSTEQK